MVVIVGAITVAMRESLWGGVTDRPGEWGSHGWWAQTRWARLSVIVVADLGCLDTREKQEKK
jgi:hypothetical protein